MQKKMMRGARITSAYEKDVAETISESLLLLGEDREFLRNKISDLNLDDEQIVDLFLLFHSGFFCGNFAKVYHCEVFNAIKAKDSKLLYKLLIGGKQMFVEAFSNNDLDPSEQEQVESIWSRERREISTLLFERRSLIEIPKKTVSVTDQIEGSRLRRSYLYKLFDLIEILYEDECVNIYTDEEFSEKSLEEMLKRFSLEIKLYSFYRSTTDL